MVVVAVIEKSSNVWSTGSNDSPEQRNSRKVAFRMVTTFPGGGGRRSRHWDRVRVQLGQVLRAAKHGIRGGRTRRARRGLSSRTTTGLDDDGASDDGASS
jgi:hypothetical protein